MSPNNGSNGPSIALLKNDSTECPWKSLTAVKNCNSAVAMYKTVFDRLQMHTLVPSTPNRSCKLLLYIAPAILLLSNVHQIRNSRLY